MPCKFPDDAWSPAFIGLSKTPAPLLPSDWATTIKLDAPPDPDKDGCKQLADYKVKLRDARRKEIEQQALSANDAIWPVQEVIGSWDLPLKPATKWLVSRLLANLTGPTFHFKEDFNRGRPSQCCTQVLDPMFPPGSPYYPGHPAYPSGHSTNAHAVAMLCAVLVPAKKDALMAAADRVAQNREIAGLHYPTDSAAGASLAGQVLELFLQNADVMSRLDKAKAEWPSAPPSRGKQASSPRPKP